MTTLEYAVLIAIVWFAIFVFGHFSWACLVERPRHGQIIIRAFVIALLLFTLTMIVMHGLVSSEPVVSCFVGGVIGLFIMACAFVLYVPFVFVVSSSLSVDTLVILDRFGGTSQRDALYRLFVSPEAVHRRLEMMRMNGLVVSNNGRYVLATKAIYTASFFTKMKHLWKLWPGG